MAFLDYCSLEQSGPQPDQDSYGLCCWISALIFEFREAQADTTMSLEVRLSALPATLWELSSSSVFTEHAWHLLSS